MAGTITVEGTLTVERLRAFYDRPGFSQNWQRFFEDPGVGVMPSEGDFNYANKSTCSLEGPSQ
jgi:hypothetical protein